MDDLIVSHMDTALRFVRSFARRRRIRLSSADSADLAGEAHLLLVQAARTYSPHRGKFSTYLYEILRRGFVEFENRRSILTFPAHICKDAYGALSKDKELCRLMQRAKNPKRISPNLPQPEKEYVENLRIGPKDVLLLEDYFGIRANAITQSELARREGVSQQAIQLRIARAIKRARVLS